MKHVSVQMLFALINKNWIYLLLVDTNNKCILQTGVVLSYENISSFGFKAKAEKADDAKSRLIMEKLEEDETKEKAKQEMLTWASKQDECRKEFTQSMSAMQVVLLSSL